MSKNLSERVAILYKQAVNPLRLEFYINPSQELLANIGSDELDKKSTDDIIIVYLTI